MKMCIIVLYLIMIENSPILSQDELYGEWVIADTMNQVTEGVSTLLQSGKVLVAGNNSVCELYDISLAEWQVTDSMSTGREGHSLITLQDGRALVMGGLGRMTNEIYDESNEEWTNCAFFNLGPRYAGRVVLLNDGRVLYIGGHAPGGITKTCEMYNPVTDLWTTADSLEYPRVHHQAILLNDGRILVTGGASEAGSGYLNTCEIYNPATDQWTEVAPMIENHVKHDVLLLPSGYAMVLGGDYHNNSTHCEIYNHVLNEWNQVESIMPGCSVDRGGAVLLNDSTILIIDKTVWGLYDVNSFSPIGLFYDKNYDLSEPMVELLGDGSVITMGGWLFKGVAFRPAKECEIYRPAVLKINSKPISTITGFKLSQNYPNPFNPQTKILITLPLSCQVLLKVYDLLGHEIYTLVNTKKRAGTHELIFDASELPSGIYYYRLITPHYVKTKKMLKLN